MRRLFVWATAVVVLAAVCWMAAAPKGALRSAHTDSAADDTGSRTAVPAGHSEPAIPVVQNPAAAGESRAPLPNVDVRLGKGTLAMSAERAQALARLKKSVPGVSVELDSVTGSPKWIGSNTGLLTKSQSDAAAKDADAPVRQFIDAHRELFGHGAGNLDAARRVTDYTTARSGSRKVVWHQQLDGIDIFEAVLQANLTASSELINISSQLVANPEQAAGNGERSARVASPKVDAAQAVAAAGANVGERVTVGAIRPAGHPAAQPDRRQQFRAAMFTDAEAKLVWVPMDPAKLRLAWDVTLSSRSRGEMYRVLVDSETGDVLVRHSLTEYISDATYRVYTSESPTPFSPGHETPSNLQPAETNRVLVTTPALNTTASPNGWIDDGGNMTSGNNADAYTDTDNNNTADLPRTQGSPARVFDFPMPLTQEPSTYKDASVTQLFYWTNFAHDRLYELGFTEAAGNFQINNFGRGGAGNDLVRAEAQDGSGTNNANFSTPPDGSAGRMQMFNWTGPTPDRDGSFEAEVVLHEYCHGLSNRLVGGPSVTMSALASRGMGEGWSDFYGLALTAEATDNPHGNWARAGYSRYQASGWFTENYYFGARRYSYSTDMLKNPHTFRDIDPGQVDWHTSVPRNPTFSATQDATQVHYVGTVWAVMLWDLRANLILKHGFSIGNERAMFLVTEGMKLCPANPNLVQARDGIIQATLVNHPGDLGEVWTAFAKRGMGDQATAPVSSTTTGITESYSVPDNLEISDRSGWNIRGNKGGPFSPVSLTLTLRNDGNQPLTWTANTHCEWLSVSPASGTLSPGAQEWVTVTAEPGALKSGFYSSNVVFTNVSTTFNQPVGVRLYVSPPVAYSYDLNSNPGWTMSGQWAYGTPTGGGGMTGGGAGNVDPSSGATGSNVFGVNLAGNVSNTITGPHYLTSGAVNLTHHANTRLRFQCWLNNNTATISKITVEVSADGTNWHEVFANPLSIISSTSWQAMEYDISRIADGQPAVRARWSYQTLTTATPYSGWNIDDIQFLGEPQLHLALDFPPIAAEDTPPLTATLTLTHSLPSDLPVSLSSGDPAAATVPASVVIPAGQISKTFAITPVNDSLLDGTQVTLITASTAQTPPAMRSLTVNDNETATMTLTAPATINEGASSVAASLNVSRPVDREVRVQITTSSGALVAPSFISIPAGTSGPVALALSAPDNAFAEGTKRETLTASVTGWTPGIALIDIIDNEAPAIVITGPNSLREGDGTQSFTATVNTIQTVDLVLNLNSSDLTELTVPGTVTIPAGQFTANFTAAVIEDVIFDGVQSATITATKSGYASGARTVTIADNEVDHYTLAPIASPKSLGIPFSIAVTARDINGAIITNHSGSVTLTSSSPAGTVPFTPGTLSGFSNGVATGAINVNATAAEMTLTAADTGGKSGVSNAFDVSRGPALTIAPSGITLSMLPEDAPATRQLTLSNPGSAQNAWSASVLMVGAESAPALATVLSKFDAGHAVISALVPNRFNFTDGITGSSISDGGSDMYDGGNFLATNLTVAGTNLSYSNGTVISNANLGTGGKYFTRKQAGLFVFAADVAGLTYFEITGDLGADGGGSTDTSILTRLRGTATYKGFVKRVYNAGDPSINHLIIIRDNGVATHTASTDTNSDFHRLSNLSGVTRIYYLLYASNSGGYVSDTQTQAIMDAFLDAVVPPEWLGVAPASGTVASGGSAQITASINPVGLQPGVHNAVLRFSSQDVLAPQQDLPVTLNILRPLNHFAWAPVSTPQSANEPFVAAVTARADDGSLVPSFQGDAALSAVGPMATTTSGAGTVSGSFPLIGSSTEARMQAIYTPAEVGPAGRLLSLGFDAVSIPGAFANFTVRIKHTAKANYSGTGNAVWESEGWTKVYQNTLVINTAGWQTLPLTGSFDYDGTSNLMVDITFDNVSSVSSSSTRATAVSPNRMLTATTTQNSVGNPLDWWGTMPAPAASSNLTNLRFTSRPILTMTPQAATFVDGQWTGSVSLQRATANVMLRAVHATNPAINGESNAFAVGSIGALGISIPAGSREGDVLVATVSVTSAPAADLVVSLQSSDLTEITVPATMTIPAGQLSAPVTLTLPEDAELDGSQTVFITATAAGYTEGKATMAVGDNESATVTVTLPPSMNEGGVTLPAGGAVTLNVAPTSDITLSLQSSDTTELNVPPFLTIPTGQTSATFALVPVPDSLLDGDQTVTVTATLASSPPGTASITVSDDEPRTISVSLNYASRSEGSGTTTAAGTVSLGGTAVDPIVVTLTSSDLTELQHSSVTINPGFSSAPVSLTAVNDALFDGTQTVTITASAATFANDARNISITDDDVHNFLMATVPSPQVKNAPFNVTFTARDVNNVTIMDYAGTPTLTAASGSMPLPVTPGTVTGFTNGVKTQSVSVQGYGTPTILTLTDGTTGGSGSSGAFSVTHGALSRIAWESIPSPQVAGTPFSAALTALDNYGNVVSAFTGTAALAVPSYLKVGSAGTTLATVMNAEYRSNRAQVIYTAAEVGGARNITGLAIEVTSLPAVPLANFTVRMKHTTKNDYLGTGNAAWEAAGWTICHQSTLNVSSVGWIAIPFTTPFDYNGTQNVMVDLSFSNSSSSPLSGGLVRATSGAGIRTLSYADSGIYATPLTWTGTGSPAPSSSLVRPDVKFNSASQITPSPSATTAFVGGTWSGNITVPAAQAGLQLLAQTGSFATLSNPFDVIPLVSPALAPEPLFTGGVTNEVSWNDMPPGQQILLERDVTEDFTSPFSSPWLTTSSHIVADLIDGQKYYFRAKARRLGPTPPPQSWNQTSSAEFESGVLSNADAKAQSGSVQLAANALQEAFEGAAGDWSDTLFTRRTSGTFGKNAAPSGVPATSPNLPVSADGDREGTIDGAAVYALAAETPENIMTDGSITAYIYPRNQITLNHAGLLFRTSGFASTLQGYQATLHYNAGLQSPVWMGVSKITNGSVTTLITAGTGVAFDPATEHFKMQLAVSGSNIVARLWKISVVGGVVTETLVSTRSGSDSSYASGVGGLYVNQSAVFDDVVISSGSFVASGSITSPKIEPADLDHWSTINFNQTTPVGTAITFDVLDPSGATLATNLSSGTNLGELPAIASQPAIKLRATFSTSVPTVTPGLHDWSVSYVPASSATYSAWSNIVSSTQDASPPIINVGDLTVMSSSASLTGSAVDNVSGVAAVSVAGSTATTANGFTNWSASVTGLNDGPNTVLVTASDNAAPPNAASLSTTIYRISDPEGDPAGDGVNALLRHALGVPAGGGNPRSMLPTTTDQTDGGQRYLIMDYRRRIQRGGLQYVIETSSDLVSWNSIGADIVEQSVTPNGDGATETVRIRVIPAIGLQGAKFVRLRVEIR